MSKHCIEVWEELRAKIAHPATLKIATGMVATFEWKQMVLSIKCRNEMARGSTVNFTHVQVAAAVQQAAETYDVRSGKSNAIEITEGFELWFSLSTGPSPERRATAKSENILNIIMVSHIS
jgi:hypothetical protein